MEIILWIVGILFALWILWLIFKPSKPKRGGGYSGGFDLLDGLTDTVSDVFD